MSNGAMLEFVLSAESKGQLGKISRQLQDMSVPEDCVQARYHDTKVSVRLPAALGDEDGDGSNDGTASALRLISCVRGVQRAAFAVRSTDGQGMREALAEGDEEEEQAEAAAAEAPSSSSTALCPGVERFAATACFRAALAAWESLHGRPPATWTLDTKKRLSKQSVPRQPSTRALQEAARRGLLRNESLRTLRAQHSAAAGAPPDLLCFLNAADHGLAWTVPLLRGARPAGDGLLRHKGLHHTVAWGVAALAGIREGDVVADPCVGKGGLLFEAQRHFPAGVYLGLDLSKEQLACAVENNKGLAKGAGKRQRSARTALGLELARSDAAAGRLPLRAGCVDVVLADLPFGRMWGSEEENAALYPALCVGVARALVPGGAGRAVLLTGEEGAAELEAAVAAAGLRVHHRERFRFGGNKHTQKCVAVCAYKPAEGVVGVGEAAAAAAAAVVPPPFTISALTSGGGYGASANMRDAKPCMAPYMPQEFASAGGGGGGAGDTNKTAEQPRQA